MVTSAVDRSALDSSTAAKWRSIVGLDLHQIIQQAINSPVPQEPAYLLSNGIPFNVADVIIIKSSGVHLFRYLVSVFPISICHKRRLTLNSAIDSVLAPSAHCLPSANIIKLSDHKSYLNRAYQHCGKFESSSQSGHSR